MAGSGFAEFVHMWTYQLIKDLVVPEKPTAKKFEELVQLVNAHKRLQPSLIVQRFHFHSRGQMKTRDHFTVCYHPQTTVNKLQLWRCFGRNAMESTSLWAARCSAIEEAIVRERPYLPTAFDMPGP